MYGDVAVNTVVKELSQLHDRNVLLSMTFGSLTPGQHLKALQYLMFVKRKWTGSIKARGCADGRKQRTYLAKEDTSSPTVSIKAVMLTSIIDVQEGHDVVIVDIPGAFLHADADKVIHMWLEGQMVELLVQLVPALYSTFIHQEAKGKRMLFVQLKKALYGTLKAALFSWRLLRARLIAWGFEINDYDWCVANRTLRGLIAQSFGTWMI